EEGDRRRQEHQQSAHHRRPLLDDMVLRAVLADRLAHLVAPQELDELRPGDDRDHHRHDAGDQDAGQGVTTSAARASATTSSPIAREPFTSTQSPGSTIRAATSSPSSSVGAQTASTPLAPSTYPRASCP